MAEPNNYINEIMIPKTNKVYLRYAPNKGSINKVGVATLLKRIESLGFTFNKEAISILLTWDTDVLALFEKIELVPILKTMIGANKTYTPMYPNFPKQVMEASDAELYINAMLHYFGDYLGVRIMPEFEVEYRPLLSQLTKLTVLGETDFEGFGDTMYNIMSANTSISPTDVGYLEKYIKNSHSIFMPPKFKFKEILTTVTALMIKHNRSFDMSSHYKNATDVLRLATALSEGDVSLASNTKFKKFNRFTRKMLLGLLEASKGNLSEDMYKYKYKWIALGEIIHPTEYRAKFPKVGKAFDDLRNNVKIERFNSNVEKYIANDNIRGAVYLLKTRPTMFARKLNELFNKDRANKDFIMENFAEIVNDVSTPVLLQLVAYFKNRGVDQTPYRIFFPKGSTSKMKVLDNTMEPYTGARINMIVAICEQALLNRFALLPKMGDVYIDEGLKDYLIPFSERSASNSQKSLVRGSKVAMPSGSTLRFFMWWTDGDIGGVDLDLSAQFLNENWGNMGNISYTNLRNTNYQAYHSGDITSAPNDAAEFIDIDINSAVNHGARYVVMNVLSYSGQAFTDIDTFAGWMMRDAPNSGEIFDPKTVQNRFDISASARTIIPMIFDLVERKMIWMDVVLKGQFINNVENNFDNMNTLVKSFVDIKKANMYDLLSLHVIARGTQIDHPDLADTMFTSADTPYEFNHEWLA